MSQGPNATTLLRYALRDGVRLRMGLEEQCGERILAAARIVAAALGAGNKVLLFGNGGSAADAQHIAAELVGRFVSDRAPLPGMALGVDSSVVTAIANDFGYDHVFARQIRAHGRPGDVAIAISTSGRSPSVLEGIAAARELGLRVVVLTGRGGRDLAGQADACIAVGSRIAARIQECHITIGHIVCELVERALFGERLAIGEAAVAKAGPSCAKHVDLATLLSLRSMWRAQEQTVVWTNGCFDLLHAGHVASLEAARRLGDVLVVGVNADATVRALKGPGRPVFPVEARIRLLAALEVVDHVVVFDEQTPRAVLSELQPDIHCKGEDYAPSGGAPIPEADVVASYGGRVAFVPLVAGLSTSSLLERLRSTLSDDR